MKETYTASIIHEFGSMQFEEKNMPQIGVRELLVKLIATGVCHSDVHTVDGDWPAQPALPTVAGHEGIGEVIAVGAEVRDVQVGDWVGNAWDMGYCGDCEFCNDGWETLCEERKITGYDGEGSFAEYMVVDAKYASRIPQTLDPLEVAPLLCAGVTVYKGIKQAFAVPGTWMAIVGVGGLGHIAVQYAKAMGYRVIAVDINDAALELALEHGAEFTVNSALADEAAQRLREITGRGPQTVLVAATHHSGYTLALDVVRRGGTVIGIGVPPENIPVHISVLAGKALTFRGSTVGTRRDIEEAIGFYERGLVKPSVTVRRFSEVGEVINELRAGQIRGRAVIDFRQ